MPKQLRGISLFCGVGGLDSGFLHGGVKLLRAYDIDPDACKSYSENFGLAPLVLDIRKLAERDIGRADIIWAAPPCQGFTNIGQRRPRDSRNSLILVAAKLIAAVRPRAFVIENVPGINWVAKGDFLRKTILLLEQAGMHAQFAQIDCSRLGVAQKRRRILIFGGRGNVGQEVIRRLHRLSRVSGRTKSVGDVLFPVPPLASLPNHSYQKHGVKWYAHILKAVGPGMKLCDTRLGRASIHSWDIPEVFGRVTENEKKLLKLIARARRLEWNGRWKELGDGRSVSVKDIVALSGKPPALILRRLTNLASLGYVKRLPGNRFDLARKFNGRFRRLSRRGVSPAVIRAFGSVRTMIHPTRERALTVRECARLQGFRDDFVFFGNIGKQYQLVANAFPPPVARRIAAAVVGSFR